MYRYSPPKKSILGHSLRKMDPSRQKALFDEFLKKAVAEYSFGGGNLTLLIGSDPAPEFLPAKEQRRWGHVTSDDARHFEQLFGTAAHDGYNFMLRPRQCELALTELIQNRALIPGSLLVQGVNISKWLIEGQPVATQSAVTLFYGYNPCILPFLEFETIEQFEFIKRVLSDLSFCKLNEKNLKPMKRGLKKKSGQEDVS